MPTGEHGVAVEKHDLMPVMFKYGLNQQQRLKCSFDPAQILNPAKSSRSRKVGGEGSLGQQALARVVAAEPDRRRHRA